MANCYSAEAVALQVQRARIRLALSKPFLASAVLRLPLLPVQDAEWCSTAATDGYHLFYNPKWVHGLGSHETRGLLAHEVLHVVFGHGERRQGRDPHRWNIACDHAINLLLLEQGFRLPADGMADAIFAGQTAEQIYEQLPAKGEHSIRRTPRGGDADSESGIVPGIGTDLVSPDHPAVRPLRTGDAPDIERVREIRAELAAEISAKLQGSGAGAFQRELGALQKSRIDWRALLRVWLTDRLKSDWSSFPFNKKHLHRGLFLPSLGVEAPGEVVFAIDTSGSMDDETLAKLLGELAAFREAFPCRVTLLQADAAIQEVRVFEAMDGVEVPRRMKMKGRGGTDFRPVFDWLAREAPDAILLYATDGMGTFPKSKPPSPVLWLLTPPHVPAEKIPFGACVEIPATSN
jgi:predicted metal-dependent peptidase